MFNNFAVFRRSRTCALAYPLFFSRSAHVHQTSSSAKTTSRPQVALGRPCSLPFFCSSVYATSFSLMHPSITAALWVQTFRAC